MATIAPFSSYSTSTTRALVMVVSFRVSSGLKTIKWLCLLLFLFISNPLNWSKKRWFLFYTNLHDLIEVKTLSEALISWHRHSFLFFFACFLVIRLSNFLFLLNSLNLIGKGLIEDSGQLKIIRLVSRLSFYIIKILTFPQNRLWFRLLNWGWLCEYGSLLLCLNWWGLLLFNDFYDTFLFFVVLYFRWTLIGGNIIKVYLSWFWA